MQRQVPDVAHVRDCVVDREDAMRTFLGAQCVDRLREREADRALVVVPRRVRGRVVQEVGAELRPGAVDIVGDEHRRREVRARQDARARLAAVPRAFVAVRGRELVAVGLREEAEAEAGGAARGGDGLAAPRDRGPPGVIGAGVTRTPPASDGNSFPARASSRRRRCSSATRARSPIGTRCNANSSGRYPSPNT